MEDLKYQNFAKEAREFLPNAVFDDYLRRFAYSTDASCYLYIPKVVCVADSEESVVKLIKLANKFGTPLTFRAAGSSLSVQCSSKDILVVANDNFKSIEIAPNSEHVCLSCGVIGSDANEALKRHGKKIGPDPATIATALIGGIFNNNSSGMCCGVKQNSYNTVKSIRVILHDGTILDTSSDESVNEFCKTHGELVDQILKIRDEISQDSELCALINRKYKIKNTTGYSLNSFVDFSELKDIINHIFVGSEGTLGFVSKVVYECIEDKKFKACGLLFYENLDEASKAVVTLGGLGDIVSAAEMMDYACLVSVRGIDGVPKEVYEVQKGTTCILLQTESNEQNELEQNLQTIKLALSGFKNALEPLYSQDSNVYDGWWKIRKGILPIAASKRRSKSSVITEDVCFTIDKFCDGVKLIQDLFEKYDFSDIGIIFGHALAGNLHFVITPLLNDEKEFNNFKDLVEDMAKSVSMMGGSVKAEHGTGRMVAPFVELEWGEKAYAFNRKIKATFDPKGIFNPDVIISDDKEIHAKNLKDMNETDDYINFCMECGFCEKACPSKFLTLTPRQRIAVTREISRLKNVGETNLADELQKQYEYYGDETCAACSMCKTLCPLAIDTAKIAINLRKKNSHKTENLANKIYSNMSSVVGLAKFGLSMASITYSIFGAKNISKFTNKINSFTTFPATNEYLPLPNRHILKNKEIKADERVVYFTTCMNRGFAPSKLAFDKRPIQEVFESICDKANVGVIYPDNINELCCGKAFMDYEELSERIKEKMKNSLLKATQNGKYLVVIDHSACATHAILSLADTQNLKIMDISEYVLGLLPRLKITKKDESILVHKMCAMSKIGKADVVKKIAEICASRVYLSNIECCGFAGNKGFFTPELNASATKSLKFIPTNIKRGFSTSSTCEIGLSGAAKVPFQHIMYLVDECSN